MIYIEINYAFEFNNIHFQLFRYIEIFTSTVQQLRRSIMQTNQVQGQQRSRNYTNDNRNMDNDSSGNFGPMRDKRNNRNNVRKPYNNDEPGFRSKYNRIA